MSEIYKTKRLTYLLSKFSIFFDMYLKTYMDIFSRIFKIVTLRALRQLLLFCIKLSHWCRIYFKLMFTSNSRLHYNKLVSV